MRGPHPAHDLTTRFVATLVLLAGLAATVPTQAHATCTPLPGNVSGLLAVKGLDDVALTWQPEAATSMYNVWKVDRKWMVQFAGAIPLSQIGVLPACHDVVSAPPACSDGGAVPALPSVAYYQVRGTCPDGTEGVETVGCTGLAYLSVTATRSAIPSATTPDGACGAPGPILPVTFLALATDGLGLPVVGCPVLFYTDFAQLSNCGRAFGEFCGLPFALTDPSGQATADFTMLQQDYDFCNCLPSDCNCVSPPGMCAGGSRTGWGYCPTPSRCSTTPTCRTVPAEEDLFCQIAMRAVSSGVSSINDAFVEYGR